MEDVWISRYELEAGDSLNARSSRRVFNGALVRMGAGFGCLHPWPELGDPTLEQCLEDLGGARQCRIVKKTLACIEVDGAAREGGRSLFDGIEVPVSHATLPTLSENAVDLAVERGFSHVKTKAGGDTLQQLKLVRQLMRRCPDLRWRIDFNESGVYEELVNILNQWSIEELRKIDFLEDPILYHSRRWASLSMEIGLPLANDRHQDEDCHQSDVLVLKPAVDVLVNGEQRLVVTSYMDHPFGQCFAAWEAARLGGGRFADFRPMASLSRVLFLKFLATPSLGFILREVPAWGLVTCWRILSGRV